MHDRFAGASTAGLVIGGMLAMAAVFGFGRFVYTPILPHMISDGLTPSAAGLLAAANYLGYLASALLGITGIMRRGAHRWLLGGVAISGIALFAMAFAQTVPVMFVLRFLSGAGSAVIMVAGATLVFGPLLRRGGLYGMAPFCGVGLGIVASSLLVAGLARAGTDWRGMWSAAGIVASIMTLLIAWLVPNDARSDSAAAQAREGSIAWSRRLLLLVISYGLFGIGYVITATFIVVITRETPALTSLEPYVWSIVGLAGAASIPFWSWITRKTGEVVSYAIMMLAEGTGVALSVVDPSPIAIVASAILLGGTIMAITAVGLQLGRRYAVDAPQKISAVMTAAFGIGQVVGPLIAGHMREVSGSFLAPSLIAAGALAVGAALALVP